MLLVIPLGIRKGVLQTFHYALRVARLNRYCYRPQRFTVISCDFHAASVTSRADLPLRALWARLVPGKRRRFVPRSFAESLDNWAMQD
jgi:hypothetical protein